MKRFLILLFPILAFAFVVSLGGVTLSEIFKGDEKKNFSYYSSDLGFILEEKEGNYVAYKEGESVVGECVFLDGGREKLNKIADKLGLMVNKKYFVGETLMVEGFSPRLSFLGDGKNNVQIALSGETIVVGSPIIYGSY